MPPTFRNDNQSWARYSPGPVGPHVDHLYSAAMLAWFDQAKGLKKPALLQVHAKGNSQDHWHPCRGGFDLSNQCLKFCGICRHILRIQYVHFCCFWGPRSLGDTQAAASEMHEHARFYVSTRFLNIHDVTKEALSSGVFSKCIVRWHLGSAVALVIRWLYYFYTVPCV